MSALRKDKPIIVKQYQQVRLRRDSVATSFVSNEL